MFLEEVEKAYELTKDINETAKLLGVSSGKIRKVLITNGLWSNSRSEEVGKLFKEGLSPEKIAKKLNISVKTVNAYLPYSKGDYLGDYRSDNALRIEKMRDNRKAASFSDRVLLPRGDHGSVAPSERDILVWSGYFQFNLSKLIKLTENKEKVRVPLDTFPDSSLNWEEELFDEPPIVVEYRPITIYSYESITEDLHPYDLVNLNNSRQIIDLKEKGEKYMDVYIFRMEEFLPHITQHLSSYISYWNEKLRNLILDKKIKEELETEITVGELMDTIEYDYSTFHLSMDCFWAKIVSGDLVLKEHEAAKWVTKEQLNSVEWLPADIKLVENISTKL